MAAAYRPARKKIATLGDGPSRLVLRILIAVASAVRNGIDTGISGKNRIFLQNSKMFLQIHRNTLENSKVHLIRRRARRTETYPILETFLFLITTRRFGGVGAPEGSEKVPDHIFLEIKKTLCFWWKVMESTRFFCKIVFLAEDYGCNQNRNFLQNS